MLKTYKITFSGNVIKKKGNNIG